MTEVRPAKALLIDFGGVLTSSVFDSFREYAGGVGPDPLLIEQLFREDGPSQEALVAHETGKVPLEEFEIIFAQRLGHHGATVEPEGLVSQLTQNLRPDEEMIEATRRIGAAGFPTVLVSNSLGYDAYDGYDLEELLDHVILSGHVGVRKPSRKIYEMGAEAAGVAPEDCVMVDDLAQNISGAERLGMQGVVHLHSKDTVAVLQEMFGIDLGGSNE
ncbi:MAG: HAD family phosphatase [Solirubrobacterales bacterium]|nr:HAD family phosphatase [Solirubrobacterales bacterium]